MSQAIRNAVLQSLRRLLGQAFVPVAVSNRHIHIDAKTLDALFGPGYLPQKLKDLSQPGQYACRETVTLEGPKGRLALRLLGPVRPETQVELSVTDAIGVGIAPTVRLSGDLAGTPGCVLSGPFGRATLERGVIVAARHLHMSAEQARDYQLKDGDSIALAAERARGVSFENVAVRVGDRHEMEVHLDFDEANCALLRNGDLLKIKANAPPHGAKAPPAPSERSATPAETQYPGFVAERDIMALQPGSELLCAKNAVITPLAKDRAFEMQIRIRTVVDRDAAVR